MHQPCTGFGSPSFHEEMMITIGKPIGKYGKTLEETGGLPSGIDVNQKTNWKDPPFLMGKSTISTGPFSI